MVDYKIYEPTVNRAFSIGKGTKIGAFCDIGAHVIIGENCIIQAHVTISNGTVIKDGVFIGPGVRILNDKYMNGKIQPAFIDKLSRIGGGAIILPGVIVGKNTLIGAGAIVTKDVPDGEIVIGVW